MKLSVCIVLSASLWCAFLVLQFVEYGLYAFIHSLVISIFLVHTSYERDSGFSVFVAMNFTIFTFFHFHGSYSAELGLLAFIFAMATKLLENKKRQIGINSLTVSEHLT